MKRTRSLLLALLLLLLAFVPITSAETVEPAEDNPLPIHLTDEEKTRLDEIGKEHRITAAPLGVLRNPSEWEPSEGVLVRWPLGIPVSLVAEMSEDVVVTTIVANASQQQSATDTYTSGGVNMANIDFVQASTNSIWVRDYGPWFIFKDEELAIVDHVYNRPRPLDDVVPQVVGTAWGLDVHGMDLIHTGGNHMSDGLGMSASTELTYIENSGKTEQQIDQLMLDYLGNDYTVLDYIQSGGIHHIDCWAKYLGPSTVMVKDVSPGDPTHDELNARADFLSQQISPWGVPYTVVRVYCPSGTWYTNSLILNGKVLVPMFGSAWDDDALQAYAEAMPGYEVLGFTGSWASEDALHCRTMGVPDRDVLLIDHLPLRTEDITTGDYTIDARIVAHSGQPLKTDALKIHYSVDGGAWQESALTATPEPDAYQGSIPAQGEDSEVAYYLEAEDHSGRNERHPYIGQSWAHRFDTICPNHPLVSVEPGGTVPVCPGGSTTLATHLTGGGGPFTYQWMEDGLQIPGAVSPTYEANGSGTHSYNCHVWGNGCSEPRTGADDAVLTWQHEPVFAGLGAVSSAQTATCALDLAWDDATPACGGPVHYNVYRSTTPGFIPGSENFLATVAGTAFNDVSQLVHGTDYSYVVRAVDRSNDAEDPNSVRHSATPTGPGGGSQTVFTADFEDAVEWSQWQVTYGPGPHTCGSWKRLSSASQRPPNSTGLYPLVDSGACGPGTDTSTDLTSPPIDVDAQGLVTVSLEYDLYYRFGDGDDTSVEVFDGTSWQVMWTAPDSTVQGHQVLDVTPHAVGNPDFRVRFRYQNAADDEWFSVDNVVVSGDVGTACATFDSSVVAVPDGTEGGTQPLLASRSGDAVSLSWDVATPQCASSGYHLIWGWGGDVASRLLSGSDCTLAPSGEHLWTAPPDTSADWIWFLVVGNDGQGLEGSWGFDSASGERSAVASGECNTGAMAPAACLP